MKRLIAMVLCLLFVISLAGCGKGNTKNLVIDYGTSSIYTKDDMDEAIDVIKKQFSSFEGCELHSLSYTSDDACNNEDNIAWMNWRKKTTIKRISHNVFRLIVVSCHLKMEVERGTLMKNTHGHGGWRVAKAERGN